MGSKKQDENQPQKMRNNDSELEKKWNFQKTAKPRKTFGYSFCKNIQISWNSSQ